MFQICLLKHAYGTEPRLMCGSWSLASQRKEKHPKCPAWPRPNPDSPVGIVIFDLVGSLEHVLFFHILEQIILTD